MSLLVNIWSFNLLIWVLFVIICKLCFFWLSIIVIFLVWLSVLSFSWIRRSFVTRISSWTILSINASVLMSKLRWNLVVMMKWCLLMKCLCNFWSMVCCLLGVGVWASIVLWCFSWIRIILRRFCFFRRWNWKKIFWLMGWRICLCNFYVMDVYD